MLRWEEIRGIGITAIRRQRFLAILRPTTRRSSRGCLR
jgi:hypothetical protein